MILDNLFSRCDCLIYNLTYISHSNQFAVCYQH